MTATLDFFTGKTVLVTGGTGSLGQAFIRELLTNTQTEKEIVFSRDEWKQSQMRSSDPLFNHEKLRYFLGDVRDKDRLYRAFHGVDVVLHAAALKQVPTAEYNPTECVKTNINGAMNVIDAAVDSTVEHVIALSTDKAVNPVNLYGATKLCSDKLFVAGNVYVGKRKYPRFSVVRYGNVLGSRGSILPQWLKQLREGATELPVTDERMTRFWITLEQAVQFVMKSFQRMSGGEIFIPRIPSMKIVDLADALSPGIKKQICGIRSGEKLHELLVSPDDSRNTFACEDYYVVLPDLSPSQDVVHSRMLPAAVPVQKDFVYSSESNASWLSCDEIRDYVRRYEGQMLPEVLAFG